MATDEDCLLLLLQLAQDRAPLYNFLLLKITRFNRWLSGLTQEAQGSHPSAKISACPVGRVLQAGLTLIEVPVWLVQRAPRLVWAGVLGCARASGPAPKRLGAWEQLGLSAATWTDLLLSCLHSLMLAAGLPLLLTWRLCQKAHCCSLGRLPRKVGGVGVGQAGEGRPGALGLGLGGWAEPGSR